MDEVLPGLYVGGLESVMDCNLMQRIDAVISVLKPESRRELERIGCLRGKAHLFIPIKDQASAPIESHFEEVYRFIERNLNSGRTVLVHCAAGRSRSVTLVVYYMLRKGIAHSVSAALNLIRKQRPIARPNPGFKRKLRMAEAELNS
jgi:protein-tyrosine phosphatase